MKLWWQRWGSGVLWAAGISGSLTVSDFLTPHQDVWWWVGTWAKTPGFAVTAALIAAALTYFSAKDRLVTEQRWRDEDAKTTEAELWEAEFKKLGRVGDEQAGLIVGLYRTAADDDRRERLGPWLTEDVKRIYLDESKMDQLKRRLYEASRTSRRRYDQTKPEELLDALVETWGPRDASGKPVNPSGPIVATTTTKGDSHPDVSEDTP